MARALPLAICAAVVWALLPSSTRAEDHEPIAPWFPADCSTHPGAPGCQREWWKCRDNDYCDSKPGEYVYPNRKFALALSTQLDILDSAYLVYFPSRFVPQLGLWVALDFWRPYTHDARLHFAFAVELAYAMDGVRNDSLFNGEVTTSATTHRGTLGLQARWFPPATDLISLHVRAAFGFQVMNLRFRDAADDRSIEDTRTNGLFNAGLGLTFVPVGLMLELGRVMPWAAHPEFPQAKVRRVSRHGGYLRGSLVLRW